MAADAGFDQAQLDRVFAVADVAGSGALLAVVQGRVLIAWGEVERRFECYSVRKSLINVLLGQEVDAGRLALTATMAGLGIDDTPPLTATERTATVFDLLRARSGIYHPAAKEPADMAKERPARGSAAAGERHWYNNWDFNALGAVFGKSAKMDVFDAFAARVAGPLGMEDFAPDDLLAELEPSSSLIPAHAFCMSARDLARVGWLYADGGRWGAQQIVSAKWVADSTRVHSATRGKSGYGMLWWSYPAGSFGKDLKLAELNRFDKFAAVGNGGQLILVVPAIGLVIVHCAIAEHDNGTGVRGGVVWDLCESVLAARRGEPVREPGLGALQPRRFTTPTPPPRVVPKAVPFTATALAALVGDYATAGAVRLQLHLHVFDGRLFGLMRGQGEAELFQAADGSCFGKTVPLVFTLSRDAAGLVQSLRGELMGQDVVLTRQ